MDKQAVINWVDKVFNGDSKARKAIRVKSVLNCGSFFEEEWLDAAWFAVFNKLGADPYTNRLDLNYIKLELDMV